MMILTIGDGVNVGDIYPSELDGGILLIWDIYFHICLQCHATVTYYYTAQCEVEVGVWHASRM